MPLAESSLVAQDDGSMESFAYVLITPARNEAEFIGGTIESVIAQTVRPLKWVIVSDGSTDGMDDIVREYAATHPWIELVRAPERRERHFSGKVRAFMQGYERVRELPYKAIGSLDGDITFDSGYFEFLLGKLAEDPERGLVGAAFYERGLPMYDYGVVNIEHVSGACQLFRRTCFEDIGGYTPVKCGGIDYIAVVSARMKGWRTRTFPEKVFHHHRLMGTAQAGVVKARFNLGVKDYKLGNHPAWELFRAAYQGTKRPVVVGGIALLGGYVWAAMQRGKRPVSDDLVAFTRQEQMGRLKRLLTLRRKPPHAAPASSTR
jgi:glycosyltransferase involved in cell wall biosynthesis